MPDNELIFSEKAIKNAIRKEIRNEKETKKLESGKNSLEKADNEIKKIQKASKTQNKKINIKNSKLSKNVQNKTKIENKLEIKSIKLQNIGPFDEKGLTINFGKKLNTKKANVHIGQMNMIDAHVTSNRQALFFSRAHQIEPSHG